MPKNVRGLLGPRTMQFQFNELGIDGEANALDQGTPALQFNL